MADIAGAAQDFLDATGSWGTISFELPDALKDIREAINSIVEVLITFLDIAIAALQLIKAFAVSYLDPLAAILKAILDTINGLLRDFANLGIYFTHDLALLMADFPPEDLRGGFAEYERRMIARLTDRSDPTRPDISADTVVFAGFFYMSVDISNIERLIAFVRQLLALFSMKFFPEGSMPVPVIDRIDYGNSAVGVFGGLSSLGTFSDTPPSKAKITWRTPQPAKKGPANPLSAFAGPTGYLVTVSTIPDGIPIWFDRPEKDSGSEKAGRGTGDSPQQNRESDRCRDSDGKPIVLHGGSDELQFSASSLGWNNAIGSGGKLKDGVPRCFGSLDKTDGQTAIIPLESLKSGSTQFFQKRFSVSLTSVAFQWATGEFTTVLDLKDMPHHAEVTMDSDGKATLKDLGQPSTYYVRVASTSSAVADGTEPYVWDFDGAANLSGQQPGPFRVNLKKGAPSSISAYSTSQKLLFPNANTMAFLEAIQTALAVLVLSRSDLPIIDEQEEVHGKQKVIDAKAHKKLVEGVALQRTGMEPYGRRIIQMMFPDFAQDLGAKDGNQMGFRKELAREAELLANRLRDSAGFDSTFEKFVVDATKNLRTATWGEIFKGIGETDVVAQIDAFGKDTIMDSLRGTKRVFGATEKAAWEAARDKYAAAAAQAASEAEGALAHNQTDLAAAQAGLAKLKTKPASAATGNFGIAQNPYCIGIPAKYVDSLMGIPGVIKYRKDHFIEFDPKAGTTPYPPTVASTAVVATLASAPPSVRAVYEQYVLPDGSIKVAPKTASLIAAQQANKTFKGSADQSPVFHVGLDTLRKAAKNPDATKAKAALDPTLLKGSGIYYVRSVLGAYKSGVIYSEASLVLQLAGAALLRAPEDGEWIAIRFFDSFPGVEGFFEGIQNWLDQLAAAIQSMADTLIAYIEFIEARLVELQQLIRRINALILSILSFSLTLPKFSGLMLVGNGTDGVLSGLVTAKEKPFDSPLAYGAGVGLVMALLPGIAGQFILSLIQSTAETSGVAGDGTDPDDTVDVTKKDAPFGLAGLPDPGAPPGPDDDPDTL